MSRRLEAPFCGRCISLRSDNTIVDSSYMYMYMYTRSRIGTRISCSCEDNAFSHLHVHECTDVTNCLYNRSRQQHPLEVYNIYKYTVFHIFEHWQTRLKKTGGCGPGPTPYQGQSLTRVQKMHTANMTNHKRLS